MGTNGGTRQTMNAWIIGRQARGELATTTLRGYQSHIRAFLAWCDTTPLLPDGADTPLDGITVDILEAWIASLAHLQPSSRNTKANTLRSFFAWATERHLIDVNPFIWIRKAKTPKRAPRRVPRDQVRDVLTAAPFRERTMILLLVQCGLRRSELAGLRVEDWDPDGRWLTVIGKGDKERTVAVPAEAAEALEAWVASLPGGSDRQGPLWPSTHRRGQGLSDHTIAVNITRIANEVGLHITAHQYRHTSASDALQAGATLSAVARQLGHESESTTSIYLSATPEEVQAQIEGRRYTGESA